MFWKRASCVEEILRDSTYGKMIQEKVIKMAKDTRFYVLGKVQHQDDTSPVELLGDAATESEVSSFISGIMNRSFPPENMFVIEGVKREIEMKDVRIVKS